MNYDLIEASKIINQGGIVIFPTDTAYGIGCDLTNEEAVIRLFNIRKRPLTQATPVLFDNIDRTKEFILPFDPEVEKLMNEYWPGALTIILPCIEEKVPELVRGGGKNLGIRIPDHEIPLRIIIEANTPILGPSANFHKEDTPFTFEGLDKNLLKLVDFVVEGKTKETRNTSTVIDCSLKDWRIIREGAVKIDL